MALKPLNRVLPLPARPTEVLEAFEVSAEIGAHYPATHRAERILEIRVYLDLQGNEEITHIATAASRLYCQNIHTAYLIYELPGNILKYKVQTNLFGEFSSFDLYKSCLDRLHEALLVTKSDST